MWLRKNADLPKHSHIMDYSKNGNNYSSLIIDKASYTDDGGTYYLNVSNHCGTSTVSVDLHVAKGNEIIAYDY